MARLTFQSQFPCEFYSFFHHQLIHIAPEPVFSRFDGLHDGMFAPVKMFCGVFILRGITTTNVAADQTQSEMNPGVAFFQTFLAPVTARGHFTNFFDVRASICRHCYPPNLPQVSHTPRHNDFNSVLQVRFVSYASSPGAINKSQIPIYSRMRFSPLTNGLPRS